MLDKKEIIAFFDRLSVGWDESIIPNVEKKNIIADIAGISQGKTVLDVACGTGVMFEYYLARNVSKITGIDISSKMVELCKQKFQDNPVIEVICADADEIVFDEPYDCCMVFNAFPHFVNPNGLIANLKKSIKAGGTLTIAHDRGRKNLDEHHKNVASTISRGMMHEDEVEALFVRNGFRDTKKFASEGMFYVTGIK